MTNIKVQVWQDKMGNILGQPVRADLRKKIGDHMKVMTGHFTSRFFFQAEDDALGFEELLSLRQAYDLRHGYTVYLNVDPWLMGHWYGWDTHTLFE